MGMYNLFVKLLDGKTLNLKFATPDVSGDSIKLRLHAAAGLPYADILLLADGRRLPDDARVSTSAASSLFPTVHVLGRLLGGKGGFGSLLRGAATKAGQKKTNNFDACRDMSGRRLRHVNAEKKLEEWRAEAEERRLQKVAEEYLKKKAKEVKRNTEGESSQYVSEYRESSAKCCDVVEASVREACALYKNSKRKANGASSSNPKKLKIWMGKNKVVDSDGDDSDEEGSNDDEKEEENEKSVVLNSENHSDSSKEAGSCNSVSFGKLAGECPGGGSCESSSEEEKEIVVLGAAESCVNSREIDVQGKANGVVEPEICGGEMLQGSSSLAPVFVSEIEAAQPHKMDHDEPNVRNKEKLCGQPQSNYSSETKEINALENVIIESKSEGTGVAAYEENLVMKKSLNFVEFCSATEMEALGMERLKSELQARGLKCGGTLQERAARLFLLKTTPLEKLPKKLLAKK